MKIVPPVIIVALALFASSGILAQQKSLSSTIEVPE